MAKFMQRLEQRTRHGQTQDDSQHQPRMGDGRKLGSPDSQEPQPRLLPSGEPEPFDEEAAARHQQRLDQKVHATLIAVVPVTSLCGNCLHHQESCPHVKPLLFDEESCCQASSG